MCGSLRLKIKKWWASSPLEQKSGKNGLVINNYYVKAEGTVREEILSHLLPAIVAEFRPESWLLNSVTLVQDKETFESLNLYRWTRNGHGM